MPVSPSPSSVKPRLFKVRFPKNPPSAIVTVYSSDSKTLLDNPKLLPLYNHSYTRAAASTEMEDLSREVGFRRRRSGEEDKESEEAMRCLIQRLETAEEAIVEVELEKFKGKVREDLSEQETAVVKTMSREIASRLLERPLNYLRRKKIKSEENLMEVKFLLRAFQNRKKVSASELNVRMTQN